MSSPSTGVLRIAAQAARDAATSTRDASAAPGKPTDGSGRVVADDEGSSSAAPASGVDSPAHWGTHRSRTRLEASASPAQCGCWSSAARRCADGPASSTCRVTPARAESKRQSTRQMLYDEFGSKRTVPRACISDFLGKSPGDTSRQILILWRNAMCTHATRRPVEGAAPRRAGLGAPVDALQDQTW